MSATILIPVDFSGVSTIAIKYASMLAPVIKGSLFFLYVDNGKGDLEEVTVKLKELVRIGNEELGVESSYKIEKGKVANTLLKVSKEINPAFIIIGMLNKTGENEFLGSMTYRVISRSEFPVATLCKIPENGFKTMIMPIDLTGASRQKVGRIVKYAKHFKSEVKLLLLDCEGSRSKLLIHGQMTSKFLADRSINHSLDIVKGEDKAEMIFKFAKENNADLIAIMTHEERRMMEYFVASDAQKIINKFEIPVLSFKPKILDGVGYF